MTKYRKRPTEVEAWQVGSDEPMPEWIHGITNAPDYGYCACIIHAFDKPRRAFDGDYIVADESRSWVMCPRDFEQTYEVME